MRYIKFTACFLLLLLSGKNVSSQTNMFLGTATHIPVKKNIANDCFDQPSWKYDAGAAVRSTPVADDTNIYFGTEKGNCFSVAMATGKMNWKFRAPSPIHSSPALQEGKLFFSDTKQTLYALSTATGKMLWQQSLGDNKPYSWKFDFFWSSPVISDNTIFIGSGDGNLYAISSVDGKVLWKFAATAHIRSTPAVFYGKVFFGDMNGYFYAVDSKTGKQVWSYEAHATKFVNDSFGYDRKGIVSSPVVIGNSIVFGSRDGYMYDLNAETGKENWVFDYHITWVISSVATDGKAVYAGTSDGKYVNAIDLQTGKELWKTNTHIVWSSPLLINDKIYVGGYDGQLYCINKNTGARMNSVLYSRGKIQSSPILAGNHLFVGSDDGFLYALESKAVFCKDDGASFIRYVYYDREAPRLYFRNGTDLAIRASLANSGFKQIDSKGLEELFKKDIPADSNVVVVMASNFFPSTTLQDGTQSLVRQFLNKGGRIVVTGLNPVVYDVNPKTNEVNTDFTKLKSILDIDLRYYDSRAHGGTIYCEANKQGLAAGLPEWWIAPFPVKPSQVDIVLGENEYHDASAYLKKYSPKSNSGLIQIWIDSEFMPADLGFVRKVALANF